MLKSSDPDTFLKIGRQSNINNGRKKDRLSDLTLLLPDLVQFADLLLDQPL